MSSMNELIAAIKQAQRITFLTGAGVSTHSGIPDYRSKTGLYAGAANPEYLLSHENLTQHPQAFYEFVTKRMYFPAARPNLIHQEIAALCNEKGTLVTQNVDGLDKQAGNQHVIEFHGNLYDLYCQKCGQAVSYEDFAQDYHHQIDGGIIRPHIVLYGESIASEILMKSAQAIANADLLLIVGTSFRVYPFAQLIQYRQAETPIYAINRESIAAPASVRLIQDDALTVFEEIRKGLETC